MRSIGKVGIMGGGSWATALAKIVLCTQPSISWYLRTKDHVRQFEKLKHNPKYLTNVQFDTGKIDFFCDGDVNDFFRSCDTIILAVPSPYVKSYLKKVRNSVVVGKNVINAVKGIVPDENILVNEYLQTVKEMDKNSVGVVSGPCHAEEVAVDRLSYLTVGAFDINLAKEMKKVLTNEFVHCAVSNDVVGIEYASVLKNIYAIASGICHGLNYGDNFQSVLISNAISEMQEFVNNVHLINRDVTESVYLGDLLVTAYSQHSRNRTFGNMIGRGYSVKEAQMEMSMIAEGYYAAKCIREINRRYKINMPISQAIYEILYENKSPKESIAGITKYFK